MQVNLSGAFYLCRAILQHMLDRGSGGIINISSIIGEAGKYRPGQLRRLKIRPIRPDHHPPRTPGRFKFRDA